MTGQNGPPTLGSRDEPGGTGVRLSSWKEIGVYLGCDARTAQRWEKNEGLPVHRHQHAKLSSVYAFPAELEVWRLRRSPPQVSAIAGTVEPIAAVPPLRRRTLSRNIYIGLALAVLAAFGLWYWKRQPSTRDEPRFPVPLTSWFGTQTAGTFSPDGAQVAFTWEGEAHDNFDIYAMTIGSAHPVRLTTGPERDFSPAWSPDGRWIAFLRSSPTGTADLMVMPALGGTARLLAHLTANPGPFSRHIAWSPDARWIATIELADSGTKGIGLVSTANGELRPLTHPAPGQDDVNPAFSPDGKTLAFVRSYSPGAAGIVLLPTGRDGAATGKEAALPLPGFEKSLNGSPAWTPDGQELIFVSSYGGLYRLWRVSRMGGTAALVAGLGERLTHPQLSLKGHRLIYTRRVYDTNIWQIDLPGVGRPASGPPVQVIASTFTEEEPQFSPDGRRIAFVSTRSGRSEIWASDPDGGNAVQLTSLKASTTGPRWSPDGKRLMFNSDFEGRPQIYWLPSGGGTPHKLSRRTIAEGRAGWSPDAKWIYFTALGAGKDEIWRAPAEGGAQEPVSDGPGFVSEVSPDGKFLYYTRGFTNLNEYTELVEMRADSGGKFVSPQLVAKSVCDRCFAATTGGVYVFEFSAVRRKWELYWHPAGGGAPVLIASIDRPAFGGMAVSRDGRKLLFSQVDQENRNLMLVENFF